MNLARGFKRLIVVASAVYWCGAAAVTVDAYQASLHRMRGHAEDYRLGRMDANERPIYAEAVRRGIVGTPRIESQNALRHAGEALGLAAAIYAGIAATLSALWWIAAGFRSDRQKDRT